MPQVISRFRWARSWYGQFRSRIAFVVSVDHRLVATLAQQADQRRTLLSRRRSASEAGRTRAPRFP